MERCVDCEKLDQCHICPKCGHDRVAHFAFVTDEGELLGDPRPIPCLECGCGLYQEGVA